jgi:PTH1 family peptidyl-tRNA hydrolase
MHLIVGLGNPGKKYQNTRHNLGARVIDELESLNLKGAVLAKPGGFMNESGKAVKGLTKAYNLKSNTLIVIHDDIDLPLGQIRIVKNRGSAGHKGVESIIRELGTKNFIRFRVGIRPVSNIKYKVSSVEKFVLQKFNKEEEKIAKDMIKKTVEAIEYFLKEGAEKAMNEFNN